MPQLIRLAPALLAAMAAAGCVDKLSEDGHSCPCSGDRSCCFGECVDSTGDCSVQKTIGLGGGTISAPDGTSLEIPFGALSEDTTIRLRSVPNVAVPEGITPLGEAVVLEPEGLHVQGFLTVPYDIDRIPSGTRVEDILVHWTMSGSRAFQRTYDTQVTATNMRVEIGTLGLYLPAVSSECPYIDYSNSPEDCGVVEVPVNGTTYRVECDPADWETTCRCIEDGAVKSEVTAPCTGNSFSREVYRYECGFPCPDEAPPTVPDAGPAAAPAD
jgi:hypothetical protein